MRASRGVSVSLACDSSLIVVQSASPLVMGFPASMKRIELRAVTAGLQAEDRKTPR